MNTTPSRNQTAIASRVRHLTTAAVAALLLAWTSPLHAAAFTWDGGSASGNSWGDSNNWDPNGVPTFDNTTDLNFNVLTRGTNFIGTNVTVRSMSFGANMDSAFIVRYLGFPSPSFAQTAYVLTVGADSNNATITVDADATGDITLGANSTDTNNVGSLAVSTNLDVVHNGTGLLLFNRPANGTNSPNITKTGSGRWQVNNNLNTVGSISINGGTLIANASGSGDLGGSTAINLSNGTLEVRANGGSKTYTNAPINVNAASRLVWNNTATNTSTFNLTISGTNAFALNANLAVQNASSNNALTNNITISRAITGSGNLTNEGYNNISSPTDSYALGRLVLSGTNTGWNGNLVIAKGTLNFGNTNALGNGTIILGETANSFGAGLGGFLATNVVPANSTVTFTNPITVRSGGFRSISIGSDHRFTFTGDVNLEGNLNVSSAAFTFNDRTVTLAGNISGVGGLDMTRLSFGGAIHLFGSNSYTGPTTISNGADVLAQSVSSNAIGDLSAVTISGFATATNFNGGTNSRLRVATPETIGSLASVGTNADVLLATNTAVLTTGGNNASTTYSGNISGTGSLTKEGTGTFTLAGPNTYTGNTVINNGQIELGTNGSLQFVIGGAGTNNSVSGAGTALFRGTFNIDVSAASTNNGDTWTLVSGAGKAYDGSFQVAGFTNSGGNWSFDTNGVTYTFAQSNSVLSVLNTNATPYSTWVSYWQGFYPGFTNTAGTDNPDGDPFDNNNEFAFDGNPAVGSPALLTATKVGTNSVFSWVQRNSGVTYQVQGTTNLTVAWTNTTGLTISNSTNQLGILGDDYTRVEFQIPASGNQFFRVKASFTP